MPPPAPPPPDTATNVLTILTVLLFFCPLVAMGHGIGPLGLVLLSDSPAESGVPALACTGLGITALMMHGSARARLRPFIVGGALLLLGFALWSYAGLTSIPALTLFSALPFYICAVVLLGRTMIKASAPPGPA